MASRSRSDSWADLTALNHMETADVAMSSSTQQADGWVTVTVTLTNRSKTPAFFMRAEMWPGTMATKYCPSRGTTTM